MKNYLILTCMLLIGLPLSGLPCHAAEELSLKDAYNLTHYGTTFNVDEMVSQTTEQPAQVEDEYYTLREARAIAQTALFEQVERDRIFATPIYRASLQAAYADLPQFRPYRYPIPYGMPVPARTMYGYAQPRYPQPTMMASAAFMMPVPDSFYQWDETEPVAVTNPIAVPSQPQHESQPVAVANVPQIENAQVEKTQPQAAAPQETQIKIESEHTTTETHLSGTITQEQQDAIEKLTTYHLQLEQQKTELAEQRQEFKHYQMMFFLAIVVSVPLLVGIRWASHRMVQEFRAIRLEGHQQKITELKESQKELHAAEQLIKKE